MARQIHAIDIPGFVHTYTKPTPTEIRIVDYGCPECAAKISLRFTSVGPPPYLLNGIRCPECERSITMEVTHPEGR